MSRKQKVLEFMREEETFTFPKLIAHAKRNPDCLDVDTLLLIERRKRDLANICLREGVVPPEFLDPAEIPYNHDYQI